MNKPPIRHFSRLGLLGSILFHTALVSGVFTLMKTQQPQPKEVEVSSISMEMLSSFIEEQESEQKVEQKTEQPQLEQPQAAVRTETTQAEEKITQKAPALQPQKRVSEPQKVKPKKEKIVKETPKEKIVEKTKPEPKKKEKLKAEKQQAEKQQVEKPKKTEKITAEKPIKAVEKGIVAQSGIVAKADANLLQTNLPQNPKVIAKTAPKATTATQGNNASNGTTPPSSASGSNSNEINAYKATLQRALQRQANNAYPNREKMLKKTGVVTLAFNLTASGQITNVRVVNSSGNSNLDAAAVKAAQSTRTAPPPAGFPTNITVPVRFSIE